MNYIYTLMLVIGLNCASNAEIPDQPYFKLKNYYAIDKSKKKIQYTGKKTSIIYFKNGKQISESVILRELFNAKSKDAYTKVILHSHEKHIIVTINDLNIKYRLSDGVVISYCVSHYGVKAKGHSPEWR